MPQIQPSQLPNAGQAGAPKLYGVDKPSENIPFQEKLFKLFKPQEFVTIKNISDSTIYWQYLPDDKETTTMSEDGMQTQVWRELPELWALEPGEVEVLVGASAYRALDVMYKEVAAQSTLKKFRDPASPLFDAQGQHLPKNFNFADGGLQDQVIGAAYLGKATPVFNGFDQQQHPVTATMSDTPAPAVVPAALSEYEQRRAAINAAHPAHPNPLPGAAPNPMAPPQANPMVADPNLVAQVAPVVDPTIPQPKTTVGAPLAPATYAQPDAEEPVNETAKEPANAEAANS